jgi:hypothetical protein
MSELRGRHNGYHHGLPRGNTGLQLYNLRAYDEGSHQNRNPHHMHSEAAAWQTRRNNGTATIDWRFFTHDARIKLKRLYPTLQV